MMMMEKTTTDNTILLLIAGAKGAIGSTLAAAVCDIKAGLDHILPYLTTENRFSHLGLSSQFELAGWDREGADIGNVIETQDIISEQLRKPLDKALAELMIKPAPAAELDFSSRVHQITEDISLFKARHPGSVPVFVNLLPAAPDHRLAAVSTLEELYHAADTKEIPDIAYVTAAVCSGIPVVNFTPNEVEIPPIMEEARRQKIPISGRDGKTGQTYFKVVLATALKARNLKVDGWYSLNILGNADGKNLMNPRNAKGKLKNKTDLLNDVLGYPVGSEHDGRSHKVHIDYYPPRGDAKEAWDVIDFKGIFGLPMSMRLNLQGRDSILAAPLVLDLCRWMAALYRAGRVGPVPELAFYYKNTVGDGVPVTFDEQLEALNLLHRECKQAPK